MGWNRVYFDKDTPLTRGLKSESISIFVHSFVAEENEHTIASTHYAASMPAIAMNRDNFFGMQFHPEKSSKSGLTILRNFFRIMNIYPAIDILRGKVVRLEKGSYQTSKLTRIVGRGSEIVFFRIRPNFFIWLFERCKRKIYTFKTIGQILEI